MTDIAPKKHSEEELAAFETRWGIELPAAYREHLLAVGGSALRGSKVDLLADWDYEPDTLPSDHLRTPFPHRTAWNDRSLHDAELGWRAPYFSRSLRSGAIPIKETGCEGKDILIVSGPERGNVWHDDRACHGKGIFPLVGKDGMHLSIEEYLQ